MSHAVQYDSATQAMRDTFLSHLNSTRNFAVAVVAVLVWDTLTNLPREYRNVWNYKFSPITLAYAIARYWILVALTVTLYLMYWPHSAESCERIVVWMGEAPIPMTQASNYIMIARIYAVWERNIWVLIPCIGLVVLQLVALIWSPLRSDPRSIAVPPGVAACLMNAPRGSKYWAYFASIAAIDFVFFCLVTYKSVSLWRGGRSHFLKVIIRDQVAFFALNSGVQIANMTYFLTASANSNGAMIAPLATAMTSITATRIVLNLREAGSTPSSTRRTGPTSAVKTSEVALEIPPCNATVQAGKEMHIDHDWDQAM